MMVEQRTTRITKFRVVPWEDILWPSDGLISWWKLNGNANDAWGSNHGAAYGVIWLPKGAGSFDGMDDWIEAGGSVDYWDSVLRNGHSIEAWAKPESQYPTSAILGFWGYHTGFFFSGKNDRVRAYFSSDAPLAYATSTFYFPSFEKWYHLVTTYAPTEETLTLWVNGDRKSQVSATGSIYIVLPFKMGWSSYANQFFKGLFDEVRIYNRALSADEIKKRYLKTKIAYLEVGV